jgi:hypothetical protein
MAATAREQTTRFYSDERLTVLAVTYTHRPDTR